MQRSRWARLTSTGVVMTLSTGLLIGLAAGKWVEIVWLIPVLVAAVLLHRPRQACLFSLLLASSFAAGMLRAGDVTGPLQEAKYSFGQKMTIHGTVLDEPSYVDHGQTEMYIRDVVLGNGLHLPGKTRLRGFTLNVSRGDTLAAEGKLQSGFGSYSAAMYYAKITVLQHDDSWATYLRSRFQAGLLNSLPEPLGSFAFGLLVGARSALPTTLNTSLSVVGLTHLVAVSGYNLTILIRAARRLLKNFTPLAALAASVGLVTIFLLLTGFSASIIRAAVVAALSLAAGYYGRPVKPEVLILLAAAITGYIQPIYVWGDVGWYLSFLAFAGILMLAPVLEGRLRQQPRLLLGILIESCSAVFMTAPYIMFIFGRVSLISPISNLLVLPFVPVAMLASVTAGTAGMVAPKISGLIALPARWVLGGMVRIIDILAALPWSQREVALSAIQLVICYGLILALYSLLRHKQRSKHGILAVIDEEL